MLIFILSKIKSITVHTYYFFEGDFISRLFLFVLLLTEVKSKFMGCNCIFPFSSGGKRFAKTYDKP